MDVHPYTRSPIWDVHSFGTFTHMGCSLIWMFTNMDVHLYGTFTHMGCSPIWDIHPYWTFTHMGHSPKQTLVFSSSPTPWVFGQVNLAFNPASIFLLGRDCVSMVGPYANISKLSYTNGLCPGKLVLWPCKSFSIRSSLAYSQINLAFGPTSLFQLGPARALQLGTYVNSSELS